MSATPLTPILSRAAPLLALVLWLSGCAATGGAGTPAPGVAWIAGGDDAFARHAPVFVHQNDAEPHNRIGRPSAFIGDDGEPRIHVDPAEPAVYVRRRDFVSSGGRALTNLIYRVHFQKVPAGLAPFHITAGPNGGLFVIATLDGRGRPLLYTTVHTCGCYLAFVPTRHLPPETLPAGWPADTQKVFGEKLPAAVAISADPARGEHPLVVLRDGNHRVMDVGVIALEDIAGRYQPVVMPVEPLTALERLPLGNGETVSFFYGEGGRKGYVRNTKKPFELLFISWWALDLRVGVDKAYGEAEETGTVFYTSLKPWRRKDSDMWPFADFLDYWGWRL